MKELTLTKDHYVPISVEVVEILIEKGFAGTGVGGTEGLGQKDGEW